MFLTLKKHLENTGLVWVYLYIVIIVCITASLLIFLGVNRYISMLMAFGLVDFFTYFNTLEYIRSLFLSPDAWDAYKKALHEDKTKVVKKNE